MLQRGIVLLRQLGTEGHLRTGPGNAVHQGSAGVELAFGGQLLQDVAPGGEHFVFIEETAQQQIAVLLDALPGQVHVGEDIVGGGEQAQLVLALVEGVATGAHGGKRKRCCQAGTSLSEIDLALTLPILRIV